MNKRIEFKQDALKYRVSKFYLKNKTLAKKFALHHFKVEGGSNIDHTRHLQAS